MISPAMAELSRGDTPRHCSASRKYSTLGYAPFFHNHTGTGECIGRLGSSEVRLQAGDSSDARIELDDLRSLAAFHRRSPTSSPRLEAKALLAWAANDSDALGVY